MTNTNRVGVRFFHLRPFRHTNAVAITICARTEYTNSEDKQEFRGGYRTYLGATYCWPVDTFSKKVGREQALEATKDHPYRIWNHRLPLPSKHSLLRYAAVHALEVYIDGGGKAPEWANGLLRRYEFNPITSADFTFIPDNPADIETVSKAYKSFRDKKYRAILDRKTRSLNNAPEISSFGKMLDKALIWTITTITDYYTSKKK